MSSGYVLGRGRENSLKKKLSQEGWLVFRCQGSAGGRIGAKVKPVDLVAIRPGAVWLIQVSKRKKDISVEEKEELRSLASEYGSHAVLAYKVGNKWGFESIRHRAS